MAGIGWKFNLEKAVLRRSYLVSNPKTPIIVMIEISADYYSNAV